MNKKIVAVTLLILMSIAFAAAPLWLVFGQNQNLGVTIIQINPIGAQPIAGQTTNESSVGDALTLQGTIYISYGQYQVLFQSQVIASGTSQGYYVDANFSVPEVPAGTYAIRLRDISANINSTETDFTVTTNYTITASSQIQEGSSMNLNVAVTGGTVGTSYDANVSVVLPSPLNTQYSKIVSLGTANQKGTATAQVTYPDNSFQPNGSLTDYVGSYTVYFNQSEELWTAGVYVSFLNSTTYHRGQTVSIRAVGYQPNQAATLSVSSSSGGSLDSESVTATADGVITKTWIVPSNAALGNYTVSIAPQGVAKTIQDSETFLISGYSVQIKTLNLANEVVPQVTVQALDKVTNDQYNGTSEADGIVNLNLEAGTYGLTAFLNGANVGTTDITVVDAGAFNFQCQLTDIRIVVQNQNGVSLPYVNLSITYQYQPATSGTYKSVNVSGQTDFSGAFELNSSLIGISYTIKASLYNIVFNPDNSTFYNITAQAFTNLVIICPSETLNINVVGNNQAAIPDARIELVEQTTGIFYSTTTDSSGSVTTQVSFGIYQAKFYKDNILINQTTFEVFGATQKLVLCTLYGIQVSVKVVDFFGNPISNANVTLNGPATERFSAITKSNGKAVFDNVIGGDMQVVAFAIGAQDAYQAVAVTVNQPTSIQVTIERYVVLGSLLIPVSSLFAVIVILVAVILLAIVEIYRRKRVKRTLAT
ncbi:MAG: carboxypeptidase-like regulatory domain-containing protein [Candidatus Bathyarchaeia archaeon]